MEVEQLLSALEETLTYLRNSETSDYSHTSVEEVIEKLESELEKNAISQTMDTKLLEFLFAPTAPIQETAIDNGWGNEYLRISGIVDQFIDRT